MHAHRQYGGADAVADGAPKGAADALADALADSLADALADHCRVLVGAVLHGLGVRGDVGHLLRVQRVVRDRRRSFLPWQLRWQPLRMLRDANSQPKLASVRLAGADELGADVRPDRYGHG